MSAYRLELSDNCYLIHHAQGWFLWDTGLPDAIAANPDGVKGANGFQMKRPKTLAGQLQELGVKPSDIKAMAISHTHPDHIGNVELFPQVMLYVQKAEYEWPGEGGAPRFNPEPSGDQARRRPRRVRRRLGGDYFDAGPHARASILAGQIAERPVRWCFRATPSTSRTTGTIAACQDQFQTRIRRRVDAAHRRHSGERARAALDQSRQAAKRLRRRSAWNIYE